MNGDILLYFLLDSDKKSFQLKTERIFLSGSVVMSHVYVFSSIILPERRVQTFVTTLPRPFRAFLFWTLCAVLFRKYT